MQRRDFLLSAAILSFGNKLSANPLNESTTNHQNVAYLGAAKSRLGEYSIVCFNSKMTILKQHSVISRGHAFAYSSNGHIAAIARRPGDYCLVLDNAGNKIFEFNAQTHRHFYGHGVYSPQGDILYLTENDYHAQNTRGVIGVYDVKNAYQRIAEFETHGIGPHQINLNADGTQLVIANGGIQTHPNSGRMKLNLASMQPCLVHLDRLTGDFIHQAVLPEKYRKNSIRHLALNKHGDVFIALQKQKSGGDDCLLAKYDHCDKTLKKLPISGPHESLLNGYAGDITLDQSERFLAVSSPVGDTLLIHDLHTQQTHAKTIHDVCGLTASKLHSGQFIVSSGQGDIYQISAIAGTNKVETLLYSNKTTRWDNHLITK